MDAVLVMWGGHVVSCSLSCGALLETVSGVMIGGQETWFCAHLSWHCAAEIIRILWWGFGHGQLLVPFQLNRSLGLKCHWLCWWHVGLLGPCGLPFCWGRGYTKRLMVYFFYSDWAPSEYAFNHATPCTAPKHLVRQYNFTSRNCPFSPFPL